MSSSAAYLEVCYGTDNLERIGGSLLDVRPLHYSCFFCILPALAHQIIIKMIALKSNSQVNGTFLFITKLKNNLCSNFS